jgi:hypothetical protein
VTTDPLTAWMNIIAPDSGSAVARALETLPLQRAYESLEDGDEHRSFCAEWSVRATAGGIDRARVMVPADTDQCQPGQLMNALQSLKGTSEKMSALAEQLLRDRPDLDLLLGFALAEVPARAKLYILQPRGRPVEAFTDLCRDVLATAGIDTTWTYSQVALAEQVPAFFALDLRADGASSGKLYFSFDEETKVDALLERLNADSLRDTLQRIHGNVSDNPNGRLVVTTRASASETVDVTLHAHLHSLPALNPALQSAWADLQNLAIDRNMRPLKYSYASWMQGPCPAESLYYTFGPIDR